MALIDRFFTRVVHQGELVLTKHDGSVRRFGAPDPGRPPVKIRLTDAAAGRAIARSPALGAAETFMDGRLILEQGDILALLDLILFNMRWDWDNKVRVALWRSTRWLSGLAQLNNKLKSRKNVAHHYDLSGRLYDLFLDVDRQYSCAYFTDPAAETLEHAQTTKKAHIAAKLDLKPGQRVLDIGCGWGGMALYLNRVAGVDVTGITLSTEQLAVARQRAADAGVADKVRFELIDYRDLTGRFDRIVSVGMFEHVGRPNYRTFFEKVRDLLSDDGVALIHTIARADGPGVTDPFTAKYIFPGGYSPALSEMLPAIEQSWLWTTDIEILRLHYAHTLEHWYARTVEHRAEIEALYDARFFRMWTFYLAAAIVAFRHDGHMNAQIQLTRRRDALPITRDYIGEAETRYRLLG